MRTKSFLLTAAAALTLFASCKKESSTPATGTVYFHIGSNIHKSKLTDPAPLKDSMNGYSFYVSNAQCILSNITLTNASGQVYTIPNSYILVSTDGENYLAGSAPAGTYTSVSFDIGLDAATNGKAPYLFAPSSYIGSSELWYGSTSKGYKFIRLQGSFDTGSAVRIPFSFETGAHTGKQHVAMPTRGAEGYGAGLTPYTLAGGATLNIELVCDYGKILDYIRMEPATVNTTDDDGINPDAAQNVAKQSQFMFFYSR